MVVYHLALFLFYRRDRSTLYFALFCLLWLINGTITYVSSWMLSFTEIHNMVWIVYRCDLISYYLTIPLMVLFFRSMFRDEMPALMPKLALLPALGFSGYVLLPEFVGLHPLQGSGPQLYHLFSILFILWSASGLIKAWQHKRSGAGLILAGFVLMAMVGVNDMLFDIKVVNTGFFYAIRHAVVHRLSGAGPGTAFFQCVCHHRAAVRGIAGEKYRPVAHGPA